MQKLLNLESRILTQVEEARTRLEGIAVRTPIFQSRQFDKKSGCSCFFKAENIQRTGSISFRGIYNKLRVELDRREVKKLVVKASEDVSLAAACSSRLLGMKCTLLLPDYGAPHVLSAANEYGANIELFAKGEGKAAELLRKIPISTDDFLISDPEDDLSGAGEATALSELMEDVPDLDCFVISAVKPALIRFTNEILKYGDRKLDFFVAEQNSETSRFARPENLIGVQEVTKQQVSRAQFFLLQRMKTLVEQSACAGPAAILSQPDVFNGKRVGVILHSGNVDLHFFADKIEESESFFLSHGSEYFIECYHCREPFNIAEAVYCNCLTPQRTFVCPRCLNCFCGAPKSYIEKFFEQAPQDIWDRLSREREMHSATPVNPLPYQVKHPLVLVVEPEHHIQYMARKIIDDLGYGVIVASDGQTGLQMSEAYQPEFILTAALMPGLDGREMCRLIKESPKTKDIKVAVMTALYTQQKYRSEAFRRFHVDEYVSKPLKMNDLQNLLRKYLDQA